MVVDASGEIGNVIELRDHGPVQDAMFEAMLAAARIFAENGLLQRPRLSASHLLSGRPCPVSSGAISESRLKHLLFDPLGKCKAAC